jgi:mono/diheme cytochrome c family protein
VDGIPRPDHTAVRGLLATALLAGLLASPAHTQQGGEELFRTYCAACHSLGPERMLGPGLQGVAQRRDISWLRTNIVEPDRLISGGDPVKAELVREYGIQMPHLGLSNAQADAIIDYLASADPGAGPAVAAAAPAPATAEQVALGGRLFEGTSRFQNRGASCNACHDVSSAAAFGGGNLSRDLTTTYSRVGAAGLRPIIASPPFPVMQRAYRDRPLTPAEVDALVAFLQHSAEQPSPGSDRTLATLLGSGAAGSVVLLLLYSAIWSGRRRGSVHQKLFDRQVRSR